MALFLFCIAACSTTELEIICPDAQGIFEESVAWGRRYQIDLLFVIDNSGNMANKQAALAENFGRLILSLNRSDGFDLHIGVVTTDVGSWTAPNQPFATSAGACDSFAGDDGKLQAVSCLDRNNVSTTAAQNCSALCPDRRFLPQNGSSFISGHRGRLNVPSWVAFNPKLGFAYDRGPEYALTCMALVGDSGCALSSPLEAMKRALDGHRPENQGFLRERSILQIVFVTDKDDCSVQSSRRAENDPRTRDCMPPNFDAPFDCFDLAYRCLARNVVCNEPLNTTGNKTGCRERADSYLQPVDEYVSFLKTLQPKHELIYFGLWTLPALDQMDQLLVEQSPSTPGSPGLRAGTGTQASCQFAGDPTTYGQPELRLAHFSQKAFTEYDHVGSSCELADYARLPTFWSYGGLSCRLRLLCMDRPKHDADGTPNCLVGDVDSVSPRALPDFYMPLCSTACCDAMPEDELGCGFWSDDVVAACRAEPKDCYCTASSRYDSCYGTLLGIWRKDNSDPPPGKVLSIRCARPTATSCPPAS